MTIQLFCGPSLSKELARASLPNAEIQGPAARGDVYLAARRGATTIGLIDGYFEHSLSVWHKEVLWALSQGVRVYGAASMGALRAAELTRFGMVGVGRVFEQFASGALQDDDEVAVVHESVESGYRPQSEAMVNLRATLAALRGAQIVNADLERSLAQQLKEMFYPLRSIAALKRLATAQVSPEQLAALSAWLEEHGAVNQKREDAQALMARIAADGAPTLERAPASFHFEETDAWCTLRSKLEPAIESRAGVVHSRPIQTGVKLTADPIRWLEQHYPQLHQQVMKMATERALALMLAREEEPIGATEVQTESELFRRERRLFTPEDTAEWLRQHGLDVAAFGQVMSDNLQCRRLAPTVAALVREQIPNTLRLLGVFDQDPVPPRTADSA